MRTALLLCLLAGPALSGVEGPLALQDPRAGWEAMRRGDGEQAAAAFKAQLAANPNDARALAGAGLAARMLGRNDQALTFLKRAEKAGTKDFTALCVLAQLAHEKGDLDLAIRSYERVLALSPGDAGIHQQLEAWKKDAALQAANAVNASARR